MNSRLGLFCAVVASSSLWFSSSRLMAQPDVITGFAGAVEQSGRVGPIGTGTVGLGMWTTSCNIGNRAANWDELPSVDHPVIVQNMYRLSTVGGADRFEQIGYAWIKHGFGSSNSGECGIPGCFGGPFNRLVPNCSDTYAAGQINPCGGGTMGIMAPRSVMHPYTGQMVASANLGGGGGCPNNFACANHIGHAHTPISHKIQVKDVDLIPALNPGARYFGEGQYIVPHEYRDGNGNQNNNVTHMEVEVFGPDVDGEFLFNDIAGPFHFQPAVDEWPGALQSRIEPSPMNDGRGILAYKVTNLGGGTWHYEYVVYNMNLDQSVCRLIVPVPPGVTISNLGFGFPLHHAPEPNADNYSNAPWTMFAGGGGVTWLTAPFSVDPLANAVRYNTLYNYRFDANTPPKSVNAVVTMYKNDLNLSIAALAPRAPGPLDCNGNFIEDTCDLSCVGPCNIEGCGTKIDCDVTGVPDECEIDCNGNGRADRCDVAIFFSSADCSGNGIPDECEPTCGGSTTPNSCRLLAGTPDCNINGKPDPCDISDGTSQDVDGNGRPDECGLVCPVSSTPVAETIASHPQQNQVVSAKNRYLSFTAGNSGRLQALQVLFVNLPPPWNAHNGVDMWVDIPASVCESAGAGMGDPCGPGVPQSSMASLVCVPVYRDWAAVGTVHVYHESIVPDGVYQIRAIDINCPLTDNPPQFSSSLTLTNSGWGNLAGPFSLGQGLWTAPESPDSVDVTVDVVAALEKFANRSTAPVKARADLEPARVDLKINISDVTRALDAFRSRPYPFLPGPPPC